MFTYALCTVSIKCNCRSCVGVYTRFANCWPITETYTSPYRLSSYLELKLLIILRLAGMTIMWLAQDNGYTRTVSEKLTPCYVENIFFLLHTLTMFKIHDFVNTFILQY